MDWPQDGTFYIVDVFSNRPYSGNQLAVVFGVRDDTDMLAIAREFKYSETLFAAPPSDDGAIAVRIFTPGGEIPFAGHPTLGAAFVLREALGVAGDGIVLEEKVGPIPVRVEGGRYWMRQNSPRFGPLRSREDAADWLSLAPSDLAPDLPVEEVSTGLTAVVVPLRNLAAVRCVRPRPNVAVAPDSPAVLVYSSEAEGDHVDYHVRVFVDGLGIPEDAATGSANGALAAYLARHVSVDGRVNAVVEQGIEMGRPSSLFVRADATAAGFPVEVGGDVSLVAQGRLLARPY